MFNSIVKKINRNKALFGLKYLIPPGGRPPWRAEAGVKEEEEEKKEEVAEEKEGRGLGRGSVFF